MTKKRATLFELLTALGLFLVYTVGVMLIDVQAIGPFGSKVGLASVNGFFFSTFGQNEFWYHLTESLGIFAIGLAASYALLFLAQWRKRKKIFLVDRHLWSFALLVVYVILAYVFFEVFVVNCRPILDEEGLLEASYPSSHTLIALCIFSYTFSRVKYYLKDRRALAFCRIVLIVLILLMVVGRLFSGVHWFSDILGSVLLSNFLFTLNEFSVPLLDRVCEDSRE